MDVQQICNISERIKENISKVIVGKRDVMDMAVISLISSGHILLEDVPGMGKTLLAKSLARSIDCDFKRIQFTPDLLPSDLTGVNYFHPEKGEFIFRPGPIFTNILLADEINRATPRTQSSLLECMEERQVSIDRKTHILNSPFMVIATQNPIEILGTFPLPEAQLDRFLMRVKMGYPDREEGIEILKRFKHKNPADVLGPVTDQSEIEGMKSIFSKVYVSDDIMGYIMELAEETRKGSEVYLGISPRGCQALLKTAQVYAVLKGRDYVIPDDVKKLVKPVFAHRLVLNTGASTAKNAEEKFLEQIMNKVRVPTEEKLVKTCGPNE